MIGVNIRVKGQRYGAVTNSYGFYSLSLPPDEYSLNYSYLGYQSIKKEVKLKEGLRLNVELPDSLITLEDLTIVSDPDKNVSSTEMGIDQLDAQSIKNIAHLFGEVDILSSIRLFPGVNTIGEGASGFNVRGGSIDQNLILLDEAPVYNSAHYFGLFSVFNPDVVKDVKLYKGGVPANFGGAVASVFDVRQKEGNNKKLHLKGGLGVPALRFTAEGPLIKNRSSFLIGLRSAFIDLSGVTFGDGTLETTQADFSDLNLKVNYTLNPKNKIYLSGYMGRDKNALENGDDLRWGNTTTTFRWNRIMNDRLFVNFTSIYSQYNFEITQLVAGNLFNTKATITDYHQKADFSYFLNPQHQLDFGVSAIWHDFNPGRYSINNTKVALEEEKALETGLYISDEYIINPKITLRYGLRYSRFANVGPRKVFVYEAGLPRSSNTITDTLRFKHGEAIKTYHTIEPRVSFRYALTNHSSLKFTYNRSAQYVHLMSNTTTALLTDIWKLSDRYTKPQRAHQFGLGYFRNFNQNKIESSIEVYYRNVQNLVDFKDGASLILNPALEASLLQGNGRAYGMEFFLRKRTGKFTGWIGYALARSERSIRGSFPEETINDGAYYPSNYDRTHDFKWVNSLQVSKRLTLSANFVYTSGRPITLPDGKYEFENTLVPDFSSRNQQRIPSYHRLDLSAHLVGKNKKKKRWQGSWTFALYNAYFRKNVFSMEFEPDANNRFKTNLNKVSLIRTAIPSVTYNFEF